MGTNGVDLKGNQKDEFKNKKNAISHVGAAAGEELGELASELGEKHHRETLRENSR